MSDARTWHKVLELDELAEAARRAHLGLPLGDERRVARGEAGDDLHVEADLGEEALGIGDDGIEDGSGGREVEARHVGDRPRRLRRGGGSGGGTHPRLARRSPDARPARHRAGTERLMRRTA